MWKSGKVQMVVKYFMWKKNIPLHGAKEVKNSILATFLACDALQKSSVCEFRCL